MASLRDKKGSLFVDFRYKGERFREYLNIINNQPNRKKATALVKKMEAEITLGTFDYLTYFPEGKSATKFKAQKARAETGIAVPQSIEAFAEIWFSEKKVEWRKSYQDVTRISIDKHILPYFKGRKLDEIDKASIMQFRAHLAILPGQGEGTCLSPSRVNHIMIPLRMMLIEGADRFGFKNPWINIKRIREPRTKVDPFSLEEVQAILKTVRKDYKAYYITRFFTGLRSSEIDGLLWKYVDFERKQILVRQALVQGEMVGTKTDGSMREVDMNSHVFDALMKHRENVGDRSRFVFSTHNGQALHNRNVTTRVWYPLLRFLGFEKRRPYQTRHTAATLWLAAGENPEWIAKQMGHSNTKMLFEVYSRYVPNLTRQDGSAFERLLQAEFGGGENND